MTTQDTTYNGWTNWETWNMALWIDNEYEVYTRRVDTQKFLTKQGKEWTSNDAKYFCLSAFPDGPPDFHNEDWTSDMNAVNYQEIADHWNDEDFD